MAMSSNPYLSPGAQNPYAGIDVTPPAFQFQPMQQEQEGPGLGGLLGALVGKFGTKYFLNRKNKSTGLPEHVPAGHEDEPIIAEPHSGNSIISREHIAGFASGGFPAVGQTIKYAEGGQPEVAIDARGNIQLLDKPGVGVVTRRAAIVPLSVFQSLMQRNNRPMPSDVSPTEYSGPKFVAPTQPQEPADNGPQWSSSSQPTEQEQAAAALSKVTQEGSQPAPPMSPMRDKSNVGQSLPVFRMPQTTPAPLVGQQSGNEFAAPSVRRSPYAGGVPVDESATLQQDGVDRGIVPPEQRRDAVYAAAGLNGGGERPSALPPSTASVSPNQAVPAPERDARRAQLHDELAKLYGLENTKAVDGNGRLRSTFLGILRGALEGFAQTGSFAGALGGAMSGGLRGGIHPEWDEELKRVAKLSEQQGKVARALAIEKELSSLDHMQAQTDAMRDRAANGGQTPTQVRSAAKQRLQLRAKQNGGTLDPNDPETKADLATLGINNLPTSKRKGINAAAIQQSRYDNNFYYPVFDDQQGKYVMRRLDLESGQMQPITEGEGQRLEYDRLENNRRVAEFVARYGREAAEAAGMKIIPDPNDESGAVTPPGPAPYTGPKFNPNPAPVSAPPAQPSPQGTPPPTPTPKPSGIPTDMYVGPPVGRRAAGRHRRSASGASRGDAIGESLEQRDAARYAQEAATARANAEAARARGEDSVAARWDEAARVADANARNVGSRRGGRSAQPAPKKGDPLGILD